MKKRLDKLVAITEVAYQARQAKLAALAREEQSLIQQLETIDRNVSELRFDPFQGPHLAGAELRWKAWNERERVKINLRCATIRAQKMKMRDEVARLFGRYQAASELRGKAL